MFEERVEAKMHDVGGFVMHASSKQGSIVW
jgi:hypothetical protein